MKRSELSLVVGGLMAIVVPAVVLHASASEDRHAAGLTAAPFAWPRLLVAHLVTAVPLGFVLAARLRSPGAGSGRGAPVAAGIVAAALAAIVGPTLGEAVAESGTGPIPALVLRIALAVGLVLPWCLAALVSVPVPAARPDRWAVTAGVLVAVVPVGMYSEAVATTRTATAAEWASRGRLVKAAGVLTGLCELGSDRPVAGKSPQDARQAVRKQIEQLRRVAGYPGIRCPPPPRRPRVWNGPWR
jgi:hypothetical protein